MGSALARYARAATAPDLPWRDRFTRDLAAHVLVHNGPLWWLCRDCRALRRG